MPARPDVEMIEDAIKQAHRNWQRCDGSWPRTFRFKADVTLDGGVYMLSALSPGPDAQEVTAGIDDPWPEIADRCRKAATEAISKAREDQISAQAQQTKATRTDKTRDDGDER